MKTLSLFIMLLFISCSFTHTSPNREVTVTSVNSSQDKECTLYLHAGTTSDGESTLQYEGAKTNYIFSCDKFHRPVIPRDFVSECILNQENLVVGDYKFKSLTGPKDIFKTEYLESNIIHYYGNMIVKRHGEKIVEVSETEHEFTIDLLEPYTLSEFFIFRDSEDKVLYPIKDCKLDDDKLKITCNVDPNDFKEKHQIVYKAGCMKDFLPTNLYLVYKGVIKMATISQIDNIDKSQCKINITSNIEIDKQSEMVFSGKQDTSTFICEPTVNKVSICQMKDFGSTLYKKVNPRYMKAEGYFFTLTEDVVKFTVEFFGHLIYDTEPYTQNITMKNPNFAIKLKEANKSPRFIWRGNDQNKENIWRECQDSTASTLIICKPSDPKVYKGGIKIYYQAFCDTEIKFTGLTVNYVEEEKMMFLE